MATLHWKGGSDTDFNNAPNWDADVVPGLNDDVVIGTATANYKVTDSAPQKVRSISLVYRFSELDLDAVAGLFQIEGDLNINGKFLIDNGTDTRGSTVDIGGNVTVSYDQFSKFVVGGYHTTAFTTAVNVAGTFTNSGTVEVYAYGSASSATLKVGNYVDHGFITQILGSGSAAASAILEVANSAAPSSWIGNIDIRGYATLVYDQGGQIQSTLSGSVIAIHGPNAFIADRNNQTRNSALESLSINSGSIQLLDGAALDLNQSIANLGTLVVSNSFGVFPYPTNQSTKLTATGLSQTFGVTQVDGVLNSPTVVINGGSLIGIGTIVGDVTVADGMIYGGDSNGAAPGSALGTLTVDGSLYVGPSAFVNEYLIFLSGPPISSTPEYSTEVDVLGSLELGGGSLSITDSSGVLEYAMPGQLYTVAKFAPGKLTGKFGNLSFKGTIGNSDYVQTGANQYVEAIYDNADGVIQLEVVSQPPANSLLISSITPDHGSNLGSVTLTISGLQINANEQFSVVGPNGVSRTATQVHWVSANKVWATFNLVGLATGVHSVQASDTTRSVKLPNAFTIDSNPAGNLSVKLTLPENTTIGHVGTGAITYTNTGETDVPAPLLGVSSTQALLAANGVAPTGKLLLLGTNASGPTGILAPGASSSVSFQYTPINPTPLSATEVDLSTTPSPAATINWSSLESSTRPATIDATDWHNIWTQFEARVGASTDTLTTTLSQDATELGQVGQPTDNTGILLQYELLQASGALPGAIVPTAIDVASDGSALRLSLDRVYDSSLIGRDAAGLFGDGWTSTYEVAAITDASGNVTIKGASSVSSFTMNGNGTYTAAAGVTSTLTLSAGMYRLTAVNGSAETFLSNGKLASLIDANGNTIALAYDGNGILHTVTSLATGETITFMPNAAGRIASATDSDGRSVTYGYNAAGTTLLSATGAAGATTYTYAAPTGAAQDNALTSITKPDNSDTYFTYDSAGRIATRSLDGGTNKTTYTYSPGEVTITDALGNATRLLYSANGVLAQVQDGLGNVTQIQSNAAYRMTGLTTAGGNTSYFGYDSLGNLTSFKDPLGGTVSASYLPGTSNLTSVSDQNKNGITYGHDANGNVTSIMYQDHSGDILTYGAKGLLATRQDGNGQTIAYGYDSSGALASLTYGDGSNETFTYDGHHNLLMAKAQSGGTTIYTYDTASRLTSVLDANGNLQKYTYNAAGQLASRTEPGNVVTQYVHDAAGRLITLKDGSGNLLDKYTYNAAGQLTRTDTGNGAYTTYQYDVAGDTTEILNNNKGSTVASRFDYTYDANRQIIADATSDGLWNYIYDAAGELTGATFQSIDPAIQNQNLFYKYDAAGNRISQTVNGVVTNYTTNNLNQYMAVGGTTYTYNADGAVKTETTTSGTTTFTYNALGLLASEVGPGGSYQYTYDALGNLLSTNENGVASDYVEDPLALSVAGQPLTSVAQINNSSTGVTTYDYGLRLAGQVNAASGTAYPQSDLTGDIVSLSASSGVSGSNTVYTPFGQPISSSQVDQSLSFLGAYGVITSGQMTHDRARTYDPSTGRFISTDPSGLAGGLNPYRYSFNNPISVADVSGLGPFGAFFDSGAGLAIVGAGEVVAGGIALYSGSALIAASLLGGGAIDLATLNPFVGGALGTAGFYGGAFVAGEGANELINGIGDLSRGIKDILGDFQKNIPALTQDISGAIGRSFPDPHLITLDGLHYDFQTTGDFILSKSVLGGPLDVQARLSPGSGGVLGAWTAISQLGVKVGADRVTIDLSRPSPVWVNGSPATFVAAADVLAGGRISQIGTGYIVTLSTGETIEASVGFANGLVVNINTKATVETAGSVEGLLGDLNGDPTKDLRLLDGTVLPLNVSTDTLYGAYANSWRVSSGNSLLEPQASPKLVTLASQTAPTPITLDSFPQSAIAAATALVVQAGITDPGLQQSAIFDYLVTGDPTAINTEVNLQQQGSSSTQVQADPTLPAQQPAEVGIVAAARTETEAASGATTAEFEVYRSGDTNAAITLSYAVVAPSGAYVGASSFGGTLPTGTISFAAGQASTILPITLTGDIGAVASAALRVQITAPVPVVVIGSGAQVQIVNAAAVAGPIPVFTPELVGADAVLPAQSGATWTFNIGSQRPPTFALAISNSAATGADSLSGTVSVSGDGTFAATTSNFANLVPGTMIDVADLIANPANVVGGAETVTIALQDTNASGYSAALSTETVIIDAGPVPPTLTGPTGFTAQLGTSIGVSGLAISSGDPTHVYTVTLADQYGVLAVSPNQGVTVTGSGGPSLALTGNVAALTAALATLTDNDPQTAPDAITVLAADTAGVSARPETILVGHTRSVAGSGGVVTGGPGPDVITAGPSASGNTFDGDGAPAGTEDYEHGIGGGDAFIFNAGYGHLRISEADPAPNANNVLQLGSSIVPGQLGASLDGAGSLFLTDGVPGDRIEIDSQLAGGGQGIQSIQFADGAVMNRDQIAVLPTSDFTVLTGGSAGIAPSATIQVVAGTANGARVVVGDAANFIDVTGHNDVVGFGSGANTVTVTAPLDGLFGPPSNIIGGGAASTVRVNGDRNTLDLFGAGSGSGDFTGSDNQLTVFGTTSALTVSDEAGSSFNNFLLTDGNASAIIRGSNDSIYFSQGTTVDDLGRGTRFWIDSGILNTVEISGFANDPTASIWLSNSSNGGYPSAAAAFAALTSDGNGGTLLALPGSSGSVDILGVLPSAIAANQIRSFSWSLPH